MAVLVLGVIALTLSACGTSPPQNAKDPQSRQLAAGSKIFSASCAGCHSLTGRDTHAPGGDLGLAHLNERQVASFARIMPVHPPLSRASIVAVAAYVARAQKSDTR
ncbi:MAG TPA: c-type cytochrome [Gaiellaceae bacterium]|jgi:mono/diheme cytochrome c family protein